MNVEGYFTLAIRMQNGHVVLLNQNTARANCTEWSVEPIYHDFCLMGEKHSETVLEGVREKVTIEFELFHAPDEWRAQHQLPPQDDGNYAIRGL